MCVLPLPLVADKLKREFEELSASAHADGVTDTRAAIVSFVISILPEASTSDQNSYWAVREEYAELLLKLWGAQAITKSKHLMTAVSATSTADLLSKSQVQQLEAKISKFEVRLT